jgi:hypothetical protein
MPLTTPTPATTTTLTLEEQLRQDTVDIYLRRMKPIWTRRARQLARDELQIAVAQIRIRVNQQSNARIRTLNRTEPREE